MCLAQGYNTVTPCGYRTQDPSLRSPTLKPLDEQHYVPSVDALRLHWQMSCWVAKVWQQADKCMVINDHGWSTDGVSVNIIRDSKEGIWKNNKRCSAVERGLFLQQICM